MKEPNIIAWEDEGKETHYQILLNLMKSDECINETDQFRNSGWLTINSRESSHVKVQAAQ